MYSILLPGLLLYISLKYPKLHLQNIPDMKLKLYTSVALLTVVTLVSCGGSDNKDYVDKSIMPTAEEKAASEKAAAEKAAVNTTMPIQNMMPATVVPGQNAMPVNMPQQPQSMTVNPQMVTQTQVPTVTQTPVPTVTQPGMNPPHGQPNHRCDIAVGAPLNSKPAPVAAQPTAVNTTPQVTMKEIPNATKTAPGMNPPHGEPNHRCDIAVGAPLNSKPAAPATIAAPALLTPAKADSSKN